MTEKILGLRRKNSLVSSMAVLKEELDMKEDELFIDNHNDMYPDKIHFDWMIANGVKLPAEALAKAKKNGWKRPSNRLQSKMSGRRPGYIPQCKTCGLIGHYSNTCTEGDDENIKKPA